MARQIEILSPVGTRIPVERSLAARLDRLEGKVIALLDNNKPGSRQIIDGLREELAGYGIKEFVYSRKAHPAEGSPYVVDLAARVDAAIGAIGD